MIFTKSDGHKIDPVRCILASFMVFNNAMTPMRPVNAWNVNLSEDKISGGGGWVWAPAPRESGAWVRMCRLIRGRGIDMHSDVRRRRHGYSCCSMVVHHWCCSVWPSSSTSRRTVADYRRSTIHRRSPSGPTSAKFTHHRAIITRRRTPVWACSFSWTWQRSSPTQPTHSPTAPR